MCRLIFIISEFSYIKKYDISILNSPKLFILSLFCVLGRITIFSSVEICNPNYYFNEYLLLQNISRFVRVLCHRFVVRLFIDEYF